MYQVAAAFVALIAMTMTAIVSILASRSIHLSMGENQGSQADETTRAIKEMLSEEGESSEPPTMVAPSDEDLSLGSLLELPKRTGQGEE